MRHRANGITGLCLDKTARMGPCTVCSVPWSYLSEFIEPSGTVGWRRLSRRRFEHHRPIAARVRWEVRRKGLDRRGRAVYKAVVPGSY
jgi:hypothetical protein